MKKRTRILAGLSRASHPAGDRRHDCHRQPGRCHRRGRIAPAPGRRRSRSRRGHRSLADVRQRPVPGEHRRVLHDSHATLRRQPRRRISAPSTRRSPAASPTVGSATTRPAPPPFWPTFKRMALISGTGLRPTRARAARHDAPAGEGAPARTACSATEPNQGVENVFPAQRVHRHRRPVPVADHGGARRLPLAGGSTTSSSTTTPAASASTTSSRPARCGRLRHLTSATTPRAPAPGQPVITTDGWYRFVFAFSNVAGNAFLTERGRSRARRRGCRHQRAAAGRRLGHAHQQLGRPRLLLAADRGHQRPAAGQLRPAARASTDNGHTP